MLLHILQKRNFNHELHKVYYSTVSFQSIVRVRSFQLSPLLRLARGEAKGGGLCAPFWPAARIGEHG